MEECVELLKIMLNEVIDFEGIENLISLGKPKIFDKNWY